MKIVHEGSSHFVESLAGWRVEYSGSEWEHREFMERIATEGRILNDDGTPMPEAVEKRVRGRLLDGRPLHWENVAFRDALTMREGQRQPVKWLIPGLWRWGTYPSLGGNAKAGKSSLVVDLVAALTTPGRRFLDRFDAATFSEDEALSEVVLINTEMETTTVQEALLDAGVDPDTAPLTVVNLRDEGGTGVFDLTDAALFDYWVRRLVWCDSCDGSDEAPPAVVIVDNMTSILQDRGRSLEGYGEFHGRFVQLMIEIGCPNGLTVLHNTLAGTHAMGGTTGQNRQDGLWNYWSDDSDNPAAKRWFNVVPRLGGLPVPTAQVLVTPEGRLSMGPTKAKQAQAETEGEAIDLLALVVEAVEATPGIDGAALTEALDASKGDILAARSKAVENSLIRSTPCGLGLCTECERPHGKRTHFWPVTT